MFFALDGEIFLLMKNGRLSEWQVYRKTKIYFVDCGGGKRGVRGKVGGSVEEGQFL